MLESTSNFKYSAWFDSTRITALIDTLSLLNNLTCFITQLEFHHLYVYGIFISLAFLDFLSEEELEQHFSKHGTINQVHIVIDKETRRSKGFAYVLFALPEVAARYYFLAIKLYL